MAEAVLRCSPPALCRAPSARSPLTSPRPQFTVAAQRERQRAGAAEISSRAVGASVFARRQEALLRPSGAAGSERGGRVHLLQALPRALSWAFGGRRVAEQPVSSELSRRSAFTCDGTGTGKKR
eukprot:scaffold6314_cov100-Isochrysis_galbana.AAC.1